MFLVGLDIVDFSDLIIRAVESKVAMRAASTGSIDNRLLATL